MKSSKEFAAWLHDKFKDVSKGVYLTREDITRLSNRQHFSQEFVNDIHYELTLKGMGFVSGYHRDKFYLFQLPDTYWRQQEEAHQENHDANVHMITKQQTS